MLAKENRINQSADFSRIFKTGVKKHHVQFTVMVTKNSLGFPRFGFIATKKVGNSVVRHRTARILREVMQTNHLDIGGFDVVVVAKPTITENFNATQLSNKLKEALRSF